MDYFKALVRPLRGSCEALGGENISNYLKEGM